MEDNTSKLKNPNQRRGGTEDTPGGTNTNTQNQSYNEADKNKSNTPSGQVTRGKRGTTRENMRVNAENTTSIANK